MEQSDSPNHTTRVKICGITSIEDARAAAQAGADYLGYILYHKSPRYIAPPRIRAITNILRLEFPQLQHVGVFVDSSHDGVCRTVDLAGLDMAQLHGVEAADFCDALKERGVRHVKVLRFGAAAPVVRCADFPTADYYLADTFDTKDAGGTGCAFDYSLLPTDLPIQRTFLAGGLTAATVAEAIAGVRPFAVDVSSGVEISPGKKSHDKIREFIASAKSLGESPV